MVDKHWGRGWLKGDGEVNLVLHCPTLTPEAWLSLVNMWRMSICMKCHCNLHFVPSVNQDIFCREALLSCVETKYSYHVHCMNPTLDVQIHYLKINMRNVAKSQLNHTTRVVFPGRDVKLIVLVQVFQLST